MNHGVYPQRVASVLPTRCARARNMLRPRSEHVRDKRPEARAFGWEKIWIIIIMGFIIQALITGVLFEYRLLEEKNYKLFGGILAIALLAAGYWYSNTAGLFENNAIYLLAYTIVLIGVAIYVCRQLFGKVLGSKTEGLAVPFGPALVLAGFVMLFFPTLF